MSSQKSARVPGAAGPVAGRRLLRILNLCLSLFIFFLGLELMGSSFRLLGREVAATLIESTSNPFVGLFVGILATSLVQSSSTITSIVVSIVAGGGLTVAGAIPIVMGANVGTSLTNTIVALGHVTRRDEFRLATAGATVHDLFNLLTVLLLLPLEMTSGVLSRPAEWLARGVSDVGGASLLSPVNALVRPVAERLVELLGSHGWVVLAVSLVVLFSGIRYMVDVLKALSQGASERALHTHLLSTPGRALIVGLLVTVMVQSSSITTSVVVPLAAAGLVTVTQIFPFVMGANIGTTITALLAALALAGSGSDPGLAALEVAFAHLCFNVFGTALFFPFERIRRIPVRLATALGDLVARHRAYAVAYIATIFFLIPLIVIVTTRPRDASTHGSPDRTIQTAPSDSTAVP